MGVPMGVIMERVEARVEARAKTVKEDQHEGDGEIYEDEYIE